MNDGVNYLLSFNGLEVSYIRLVKYASEIAVDPQRVNPLLSAKIVGSYVRHHTVGARELPDLITSVYQALGEVGRPSPSEELLTPAVSVRQSVGTTM